jgi:hypothetical protein
MNSSIFAGLAIAAGLTLLPLNSRAADSTAPPVVAKFLNLFDQLRAAENAGSRPRQRISFQLTDTEINEYMRYALKTAARPGVDSITVKLYPYNYVSTFTVVDFDAVERWKPGTIPALLRPVLHGKKSVWVDYRFQANEGKSTFSIEKAYYQTLRLPAFFVEKMVQIVAARQPEKYDTTKPLPLPFGLRQIWTADHKVMGQN